MSLEAEKIKLMNAIIQVQDIDLLHQLSDMLNKENSNKFSLNSDQIEELEIRRANHKKGKTRSYNWKEIKELVRK